MRIALFGASGLLGKALLLELKDEHVTPLCSKDADLRNSVAVFGVLRNVRPDWVILSAAYTDVDGCESNRDLAFSVNRDGAINVARAVRDVGSRLIFLSTDYVFDGCNKSPYEITDRRHPINVYGQTKAEAEERMLELLPDACIVRTSWLFGAGGKCFPSTILQAAATRPELSVVNDQRGSPTLTNDLALAVHELCGNNARGIVHVTNTGDCTWCDFAKEILRLAAVDVRLRPVRTAEFPRPAKRPAYSVLSPASRLSYGIEMPSWQDALQRYLRQYQSS